MGSIKPEELAARIDHTLLKADATSADIERLCKEGVREKFASIVVNSAWLPLAESVLSGQPEEQEEPEKALLPGLASNLPIGLCTVVSFPLGADSITAKSFAAEDAVRKGATEIDMVLNIGQVKEGLWEDISEEVASIKEGMERFALGRPPLLKIIIETPLLTEDEIVMTAKRVAEAGADFVKTNSGFAGEGAKVEDVKLIREAIGDAAKIKASAGIRTYEQALALIEAGADRIGTSAGMQIIAEAKELAAK
ncbi:MAG: deoxyribose-phosphate aldolase [Actinobacteria bacterium]|nr:MAG: deoxyribose-phosphate aldolase [Actinomycetota bacterium]